MTAAGDPQGRDSPTRPNRSALHFGLYGAVMLVLGLLAASISFMWLFAATMASDGCHGDNTSDICTSDGQQWAVMLPIIAFVSAAVLAVAPVITRAVFRWHAAWVWVGLPLAAVGYFAGPYVANWIRNLGMW